jgi:hemerythrin
MEEYKTRFQGGEEVARDLNATLRSWLINHIQHDDADYAAAVRELVAAKQASGPLKIMIG